MEREDVASLRITALRRWSALEGDVLRQAAEANRARAAELAARASTVSARASELVTGADGLRRVAEDSRHSAAEARDRRRVEREFDAIVRQLCRPPGTLLDRPRVVLADDIDLVRTSLAGAFGRGGFRVGAEASDGAEAVGYALVEQPDLAILDRQMPLLDGIGAAQAIRRYCPRTRTLLLSAELHAAGGAVDAFLPKTTPLSDILALARDLVAFPRAFKR